MTGLGESGAIVVNSTQGEYNAAGLISIGPLVGSQCPSNQVVFDGCVRVYDETGTGDGGTAGSA